jgi:hypothetical protein
MSNVAPMHEYLTGFEKYTAELPIYLESPLSDEDISQLREIIEFHRNGNITKSGDNSFRGVAHFDPRIMTNLSRMVIEFSFPENIEKKIDSVIKPLYSEDIRLSHFSYLDYNIKYGDGKFFPSLPPHIDAANTLITFNYMLGGNIDWEIFVEDRPYSLKVGDALVFSAVNQVHWRPKRKWKEGEYVEILTINYSPLDDWRFTKQENPIDPAKRPAAMMEYLTGLNDYEEFKLAWDIYDTMGLDIGIGLDKHGDLE